MCLVILEQLLPVQELKFGCQRNILVAKLSTQSLFSIQVASTEIFFPMSQPSSPTPSPFLAPFTPLQSRYFSSNFSTGSSPIPSPSPPRSIASPVAVTPPSAQQRVEIHTPVEEDDSSYFVASTATESNGKCPSCHGVLLLETIDMQRRGHIGRVLVWCQHNHEVVWFSSAITNSQFLINLR